MINTYAANGQKLRTKYYTAIFPVVGPILDLKDTIEVLNSTSDATMLSIPAKVSAKTIPDYISLKRTILRLDDYFGNILYENGTAEDAAHHPITKVLTPEGYVDYATAGKPYCYYRKDHLGSIREVDSYQGPVTVLQKTQYYPSGTPFAESFGAGEQAYKFTGKEMITMHGLNWQDFGARWLDNVRMQFTSVDPLAERNYSVSPYAYCSGNPVNRIDPDGMDWFQNSQTGAVEYVSDLHKGAEKGWQEGWQWMGANDMFKSDKDDVANSDQVLTAKNGGVTQVIENNPLTHKDDQVVVSMLLIGDEAIKFMSDRGYDKKPKEANIHTKDKNWSIPEPDGPQWLNDHFENIEKVHSWTYEKKGLEGSTNLLGYYGQKIQEKTSISTSSYTRETWERRSYNYNSPTSNQQNPIVKFFLMTIKYIPDLIK